MVLPKMGSIRLVTSDDLVGHYFRILGWQNGPGVASGYPNSSLPKEARQD